MHLSEKEENNIIDIFKKIEEEYQRIDHHTQSVILSQIDLLLNYSNRFYERQFITRQAVNNDLLTKTEFFIHEYFTNNMGLEKGILTIEYLAGKHNLSTNYLSDALRSLSGQSAQQHIHNLGFERSQSFNKLFKNKTEISSLKFRQSFC